MGQTISIVIPWSNRDELEVSLQTNVAIAKSFNISLIIVNCGGDIVRLKEITSRTGFEGTVVHINRPTFSRALALNVGTSYVSTPYVSFLDADIILTCEYIPNLVNMVKPGQVITAYKVIETSADNETSFFNIDSGVIEDVLQKQLFEIQWADGSFTSVLAQHRFLYSGARGGPGLLTVSTEAFCSIGGFNSGFVGWGFEDVDLRFRLIYALGLQHTLCGSVLHISHSDAKRDLGTSTRFETNQKNISLACQQYSRGNFQGTMTKDLYSFRDQQCDDK